jgi:hypothetical protein
MVKRLMALKNGAAAERAKSMTRVSTDCAGAGEATASMIFCRASQDGC